MNMAKIGRGLFIPHYPHQDLHRLVAAAANEELLKFLMGETVDQMEQQISDSSPLERRKVVNAALKNMKTNPANMGMHRLAYDSQGRVCGVANNPMTAQDYNVILERVNSDRVYQNKSKAVFL